MKCRARILAGLMVGAALLTAGCNVAPGNGTTEEGKWTGSLEQLLEITGIQMPVAVKPEAEFVFDGGDLTVTLRPANFFLNLLFKIVVDATYTKESSGGLDKMTISLGNASIKVLFFKFPAKRLGLESQCIYKIKELNTLYIIPGFDLLPQELRDECVEHPEAIPWTGLTFEGVTYKPLTLTRAS